MERIPPRASQQRPDMEKGLTESKVPLKSGGIQRSVARMGAVGLQLLWPLQPARAFPGHALCGLRSSQQTSCPGRSSCSRNRPSTPTVPPMSHSLSGGGGTRTAAWFSRGWSSKPGGL